MSKTAEAQTVEKLSEEITLLREELSNMKDLINSDDRLKNLKTKAKEKAKEIEPNLERLKDDIERTIHEQPSTAISIAAGLGFLVGLMMRR